MTGTPVLVESADVAPGDSVGKDTGPGFVGVSDDDPGTLVGGGETGATGLDPLGATLTSDTPSSVRLVGETCVDAPGDSDGASCVTAAPGFRDASQAAST